MQAAEVRYARRGSPTAEKAVALNQQNFAPVLPGGGPAGIAAAATGGMSFPMWVYSRQKNLIADFSAMIGNNPTVSGDFTFAGPHTVSATTWVKAGSDNTLPITVDLEDAINKIAPSSK
jgi:hypothetical protein